MVERLQNLRPEDLTENSLAAGLYFKAGLKPHAQFKEEMARFMAQVAPAF